MSNKLGLYVIFILLATQTALLCFTYYQYASRTPGKNFGIYNSVSFPIQALERPNVSPKTLTRWATLAATATFTLDFVNYETQLEALRDYFTSEGYTNFLSALNDAQTITNIIDKKLVLSSVAVAPSIISWEGLTQGNYSWQIEVPVLVSYLSASANVKQTKIISLLVTQVPTTDAPKGIGIARYVTYDISLSDLSG